MTQAIARWTIVVLLVLSVSASARAFVVPECCVCQANCPAAGNQVCFAVFAHEDCAAKCTAIGCGTTLACVPDSVCSGIPDCDETGSVRCSDGFDNNANDLVDCADPSCAGTADCLRGAPILGWPAAAAMVAALLAIGIWRKSRPTRPTL